MAVASDVASDVAPEPVTARTESPAPAGSIRKSVSPDYLICLDDGLKFKSLRRHLPTHGMSRISIARNGTCQ